MNEEKTNAYAIILEAIDALMILDPDLDSPEGRLLEGLAKLCSDYEESIRMNS